MALVSLLAATMLLTGQNPDQPVPLTKFIESMHWDAAKQGPLIAIEPEGVFSETQKPALGDFKRKLVKTGSVSAIVQTWDIVLGDEDIPNPYDGLDDTDKLAFLIANLRPGELRTLFSDGLCARDLTGQPKAALLSLLPKSLSYKESVSEGGHRFSGGIESKDVPDDQRDRMRLQVHKLLMVAYGAASNGKGGTSMRQLNPMFYGGPKGTQRLRLGNIMGFRGPKFPGHVADNAEKKSDLSWRDSRLSKSIDLSHVKTVGEGVDAIRSASGIELYADFRIAGYKLTTFGDSCSAGDLLRGMTWALCGVVRSVGPAYVLTANIEGKASREARLATIDAQGQLSIRSNVAAWRQTAANLDIYRSMPLSADDSFGAGPDVASLIAPSDSKPVEGWVSVSSLPQSLQSAVSDSEAADKENAARSAAIRAQHPEWPAPNSRDTYSPVDDLSGKVKLSYTYGYRFLLPDGRPFEYHPFGLGAAPIVSTRGPEPKDAFPILASQLNPGGGVAIKSDDPRSVATICSELKQFGVEEVWLETSTAATIQAAVDSGIRVDLMIRPWKLMKGERCADPDRNVLGLTGSKVAAIPGARVDAYSRRVVSSGDFFSPADPGLAAHWSRFAALVSTKGVNQVILADTKYSGYQSNSLVHAGFASVFGNGGRIEPGLSNMVPALFEFGFSTIQRLEFLRSHRIDPIDIVAQQPNGGGPVDPYFDAPVFIGLLGNDTAYPHVQFPYPTGDTNRINAVQQDWHAYLSDQFLKGFAGIGDGLSALTGHVMMEGFAVDISGPMGPLHSTAPFAADGKLDWKHAAANFQTLSPLSVEDEQGHIDFRLVYAPFKDHTFCYDLTDLPPDRIHSYLNFLFKPVK